MRREGGMKGEGGTQERKRDWSNRAVGEVALPPFPLGPRREWTWQS